MCKKASQRVLIIEDHKDIRLALNYLINQKKEMIVVGEADNVTDLISLLNLTKADFVLIDWDLLDRSTAKNLVNAAKGKRNSPRIIAMSMNSSDEHIVLSHGIDGFVNKREAPNLIATMQALYPEP